MTWCWQNKISLLLNAIKVGKLHNSDAIFGPLDQNKFFGNDLAEHGNENKLPLQRICHQTTKHCLATGTQHNNRSHQAGKKHGGDRWCTWTPDVDVHHKSNLT